MDTEAKRRSALLVGSPYRALIPLPAGAISQGDRQTVALMYSGILAAAPSVSVELSGVVYRGRNLTGRVS